MDEKKQKRSYTRAVRTPQENPLKEDEYGKVQDLAALGSDMAQIAAMLGFSRPSFEKMLQKDEKLREHFDIGRERANQKVVKTAFKMATSGKHPAMTIFWLKCRMKWREVEHTLYAKGALDTGDSASVPVVTFVVESPNALKSESQD